MNKKVVLTLLVIITTLIALGQNTQEQKIKLKFKEYITPRLDGHELKIKLFSGDLNGDGQTDFLIQYCIQATNEDRDAGGGNAMMNLACIQEGIAVYIKENNNYTLKTDKNMEDFKVYLENEVSFDVLGIENKKIICQSTSYGADDPRCCPSKKNRVIVKFINGKLTKDL